MSSPPAPGAATPSLRRTAVRASVWTISTGLGTRFLGVIGTLVLTHFVLPYDYGVFSAAAVVASTASQLSTLNVGTYILAHPKSGRDVMFHATVLHFVPGLVALGLVMVLGWHLGALFDAPTLGKYLPGMVASVVIDRALYMPERVLVRSMQFGRVSVSRALGELTFTAVSIVTATMGWGGFALVAGNIARSTMRFVVVAFLYVDWREWIAVTRLRWSILRDMVRFGIPVAVGSLAGFGVRRWDNLLVSRFFGPAVLGNYNLAYNLADIPAVQVGEQISDVLQAAFSQIEHGDSSKALLRSLSILAFVMTPMAVGLGCVAPALSESFFTKSWSGIGSMLVALAAISFTRPIGNTVGAYLQVRRHPRLAAVVDVFTLALLMAALFTLGRISPLWACISVGLVFAVRLLACAVVLKKVEGISPLTFLGPMLPPMLAALPMIVATYGVYRGLAIVHASPVVVLVTQIVVGAAGYFVGAKLVARPQLDGLVALVSSSLRRETA
jgi:lipopolysaccharide exporter